METLSRNYDRLKEELVEESYGLIGKETGAYLALSSSYADVVSINSEYGLFDVYPEDLVSCAEELGFDILIVGAESNDIRGSHLRLKFSRKAKESKDSNKVLIGIRELDDDLSKGISFTDLAKFK